MTNFINPAYCEVVIHVRSLDSDASTLHSTIYYPKVKDFEIDTIAPRGHIPDDSVVYTSPKSLGVCIEFEALFDEVKYQAVHVNNRIAEPNLDILLATFTKAERLKIAMEYVNVAEGRIDNLVKELGADQIQTYLKEMYSEKSEN